MSSDDSTISIDEDEFNDGFDSSLAEIVDESILDDEEEEDMETSQPTVSSSRYIHQANDVSILFPFEPYETQKNMMNLIVKAANEKRNCLLESPTGTGKTLVLLCSLLAWQSKVKSTGLRRPKESDCPCTCQFRKQDNPQENIHYKYEPINTTDDFGPCEIVRIKEVTTISRKRQKLKYEDEDNDDIPTQPCSNNFKRLKNDSVLKQTAICSSGCSYAEKSLQDSEQQTYGPLMKTIESEEEEVRKHDQLCDGCRRYLLHDSSIPKIYYTSRTHSQLAQVINEMKTTAYKDVRMTILSSRKMSCINPKALEDRKLDKLCSQMKKSRLSVKASEAAKKKIPEAQKESENDWRSKPCEYFSYKNKEEYTLLLKTISKEYRIFQQRDAWDIENIKLHGQSCNLCPYFGAKTIIKSADIVFCPYIYLLDASLSSFTGIELENSIIIFDEAHNIENVCRETMCFPRFLSSCHIDQRRMYLEMSVRKFQKVEQPTLMQKNQLDVMIRYTRFLQNLTSWLKKGPFGCGSGGIYDPKTESASWKGENIHLCLANLGFGATQLGSLKDDLKILKGKTANDDSGSEDEINPEKPGMSGRNKEKDTSASYKLMKFLKSIIWILHCIYADHPETIKHFVLIFKKVPQTQKQIEKTNRLTPVETGTGQSIPTAGGFDFVLDLICLNPAIAFRPIKEKARTIVVTSGTLAPLNSFSSELNTEFYYQKSFSHMIKEDRVLSRIISSLPGFGGKVTFTYENLNGPNSTELIDSLGEFILSVCEKVPHGVLVFVPSYSLLERFVNRWTTHPRGQSVKNRLSQVKRIFYEESGKSVKEFKSTMAQYKEAISSGTGCLLFGVLRGKISEGVDFANNQARAVISVGIPYTNVDDQATIRKKEYNNIRSKEPKSDFMWGFEWYQAQAFRALNQGLGRAIRHKKDWGIILLVDDRFQKHKKDISRWIANFVKTGESVEETLVEIKDFVERRQAIDEVEAACKQDEVNDSNMVIHFEDDEDVHDILTQRI